MNIKNKTNTKPFLHPQKNLFKNSYNLEDIYKKNNGRRIIDKTVKINDDSNNNFSDNTPNEISQNEESEINKNIIDSKSNNNKYKRKLNSTTNIPEPKSKIILLKNNVSYSRRNFVNNENRNISNNITSENLSISNSLPQEQKISNNLSEKNELKNQKKNYIRNFGQKLMKEQIINIDNKNYLKKNNSNSQPKEIIHNKTNSEYLRKNYKPISLSVPPL